MFIWLPAHQQQAHPSKAKYPPGYGLQSINRGKSAGCLQSKLHRQLVETHAEGESARESHTQAALSSPGLLMIGPTPWDDIEVRQ